MDRSDERHTDPSTIGAIMRAAAPGGTHTVRRGHRRQQCGCHADGSGPHSRRGLFGPRIELGGGLILKQIGKVAHYGGPDDNDNNTFGARFIIDKIAVDPKCDPYMQKPARGHRLALTMRVETGPTFVQSAEGSPQYHRWSTTAPDGITQGPPTSSQNCHSANALPQEFRASAKYRGEVTVETSNVAGQLVSTAFAVWKYPA